MSIYSEDPDEFVREAAEAAGVTVQEFLATLKEHAKLRDNRTDCLQPHELENRLHLPEERQAHVRICPFCQVLLSGATPSEEAARRYAAKAARAVA